MTLEPMDGLDMMTPEVIAKCVDVMKEINDMGVPILLRFSHEMNGAWYKWGQRPVQYKATWIALTRAVRDKAKLTSMVWSPNTISGYPWSDKMLPKPGSDEFRALDTNGDGAITGADDALAPYYPGAEYVDWIGQSAFHFGPYPFGTNTLPDAGGVAGMLGPILAFARTPAARGGADKPIKPFGIFEAGATYHPKPTNGEFADGTDAGMKRNVDMKTSWLTQMTSEAAYNLGVRLAMWFDFAKVEMEGGSVGLDRDFALTKNEQVREAARRVLATSVAVGAVRD
ncbi:glycoside hydrolase superfamily [Catenaria anguillulae PL171]|uniref:Glycoside hydrolase superfamily n=1 Tax=Catenaria anguillulae PL171 TaxID=765915 RepID=A0A1Y2I1E4_9FUNG|nr:glycoside hydrolase superfamily [Catenaria anguillulae PL171]